MPNNDPATTEASTAVLTLLADARVRRILQAATTEPKIVSELVDECDIPSSTTYKKVDDLVEAGLLDEQIRLQLDGHHVREYSTQVAAVTVSVQGEGTDDITWLRAPADRESFHPVTEKEMAKPSELLTPSND